ncbi:PILRB isoform 5, partial [Pan troglodytes]
MGQPLLLPLLLLLLPPAFLQPGLCELALSELDRGSEERLPQDLKPAEGGPVCVFLPSRAG